MGALPEQRTLADAADQPDHVRALHQQLAAARTERDAARAACRHSPNAQTIAAVHEATERLDALLGDLADAMRSRA